MLESVERQGAVVAKHVVMDGGSTDGTVDALRRWAESHERFEFVSEKDNGQADACAKALEKVETEYFAWLNADDILCDGGLEKLAESIRGEIHPAIVYGDYLKVDGEGKAFAERRQPSFNYNDCLWGYVTVQNVAALFNARMLRNAGGFNRSLRFVMDYDIILKLAREGSVRHVRSFCGAFRIHETSKTSTMDDVYRLETEALRTAYGVPKGWIVRGLLHRFSKLRVLCRMALQGCLKGRLY